MINHISIGVNDPEKVAAVLAEIWDGIVFPFPPAANSFIVLANDGRGTGIEITPINTVIVPGEGLPPDEGFSIETSTERHEAKFVSSGFAPQYVPTHININTRLSVEDLKAIGNREGWRVLVCNRGGGLFQLVELWIEDRFMLEVMTPEQTARYIEITDPAFIEQAFSERPPALPATQPVVTGGLSLIG